MKLLLFIIPLFLLTLQPTTQPLQSLHSISVEYHTTKSSSKPIFKSLSKRISKKLFKKQKQTNKSVGRGILFLGLFLILLLITIAIIFLATISSSIITTILFLILATQPLIGSLIFLDGAFKSFPHPQEQREQKYQQEQKKIKQLELDQNLNTWKQEVHNLSEEQTYQYIILNKDLKILKTKEENLRITIKFRKEKFLHTEEATAKLNVLLSEMDNIQVQIDKLQAESKALD